MNKDRVYSQDDIDAMFPNFQMDFGELSYFVYQWSLRKGFDISGEDRNDAEVICLMHSELSEALEAVRNGNPPDDKVKTHSSLEVELADVIIRILNYSGSAGMDVGGALMAKLAYNETRPYKHGKKF